MIHGCNDLGKPVGFIECCGKSQKLGITQMTEHDRTRGARAWRAECLLCKCTDLNLDPQSPWEGGCGGEGEGIECGVARFQVLLSSFFS